MNELQRAEYLSAIGVASYMPRFVLPLAPQPRQAELPPAQEPERQSRQLKMNSPQLEVNSPLPQSVAQMVVASAEPVQPAAGLQAPGTESPAPAAEQPQLLREIGELTENSKMPSAASAAPVAQVAPPQQQVKPFVLSCWWLGEELLAVDSREPGAALPVESLFNNIARALNWHQLPREQDRLKWPLAENRFGPAASAAEARDTCASWLEAASARRPVRSIWLMGQQAQEFCSPVPLESVPREQPLCDWNGIRIVAMPSLSQLLQEPERKRELWQLLRQTYPEQTRAQ